MNHAKSKLSLSYNDYLPLQGIWGRVDEGSCHVTGQELKLNVWAL